jgi:hypothetical protein
MIVGYVGKRGNRRLIDRKPVTLYGRTAQCFELIERGNRLLHPGFSPVSSVA